MIRRFAAGLSLLFLSFAACSAHGAASLRGALEGEAAADLVVFAARYATYGFLCAAGWLIAEWWRRESTRHGRMERRWRQA